MRTKALHNQTIYDISIQEYGSAEGIFSLLTDNTGLTLSTELTGGQELQVKTDPVSVNVKNYYTTNNLKPANGKGITIDILGTRDDKGILIGGKFIKIKIKK